VPIDFFMSDKKKISFKHGTWFHYPLHIQNYLNEYADKRFETCISLTCLTDIGDTKLTKTEIHDISLFCKNMINNIPNWDHSNEIFKELKANNLSKNELLNFFYKFNVFLEDAIVQNKALYSIGE